MILVASVAGGLQAQDVETIRRVDSAKREARAPRPFRATIDVNWTFGINGTEFFQDYIGLLGGTARSFETPTGVSFAAESFQFDNIGLGVMAGVYRAIMRESYYYDPALYLIPTAAAQTISQNIEMQVIPAYFLIDYFNTRRQFTGYIGAGLGIASVGFSWVETLSKSSDPNNRNSGVRYDENSIAFAATIRTGVSLGFDDPFSSSSSAAVYFEAAYSYIPFSAPVFSGVGRTLPFETKRTSENYSFQAGGIALKLGFSILMTAGD